MTDDYLDKHPIPYISQVKIQKGSDTKKKKVIQENIEETCMYVWESRSLYTHQTRVKSETTRTRLRSQLNPIHPTSSSGDTY